MDEVHNERVMATAITNNKQVVRLSSIYMPHSGYADSHVEKVHSEIDKITTCSQNMLIMGGAFNAELGPGQSAEKLSVGRRTLNESYKRGDWLKECVMSQRLVALNTVCRKQADKQTTFRSANGQEKQLDCTLTSRRHLKFSKNAEVNDMLHMGSDHRSVMAQFVIPSKDWKGSQAKH